MGCGASNHNLSTQYSLGLNYSKEGETEIRRQPKAFEALTEVPDSTTRTLKDCFKHTLLRHGQRQFLGTQINDKYEFITYNQTFEYAKCIGSAMINLDLAPPVTEYQDLTLKFVGVYSKNRAEWIILDIANLLYGFTLVPLYDTLGADALPYILQQTNLTTIFASASSAKALLQLKKDTNCKFSKLVFLDEIPEADATQLVNLGYTLYSWPQLLKNGKENPQPEAEIKAEDIHTICYTSGTTGDPKGAMLTHRNFVSIISSVPNTSVTFSENDVHLSYLPLPHVLERLDYQFMMSSGGSIGFSRGDPLLLKEDIARLRPTFFVSVPRLYNKFYDAIKAKIEAVQGLKRKFADMAISSKLENLRTKAQYNSALYDQAFAAVRELFGGRVRFMITGSAPISREVIDFMKIAVGCPIYEGYGQTESSGCSFMTMKHDPDSEHVGGPVSNTEFKLIDVPDMNYNATDIDVITQKPCPRGEICIRGPGVFKGYYKDPENTKQAIDEHGWLHTGDVGMILPQGNLKIIDRKKNIFKLSQGEYIAPEKIENIYMRAKGIAEVFVYGDSLQSNCVAIVVPVQEYIETQAKEKGITGSFEVLCQTESIRKLILDNLVAQGKFEKLNSLEQVKAVYLEPISFQMQGCMTATFKVKRHQAKLIFMQQITSMYHSLK